MWTKKYTAAVLAITALMLLSGALSWNSEKKVVIDPFEAWSRGSEDARITLHSFSDFT